MRARASKPLLSIIAAIFAIVLFGVSGWFALSHRPPNPPKSSWALLASFSESGVAVEIGIQELSGKVWLAGRFRPERAGFHLYSKDMPRGGIDGLGYPTILEISKPGALRLPGPLEADQPVVTQRIPILHQSFPIYPEGPVTLRLPVQIDRKDTAPAEISISYMACSPGTCLPPVIDKRLYIKIPG